jgi:Recombination endonuclease VII
MREIKVKDYIIASNDIGEIPQYSVGLVRDVTHEGVKVFFVGKGKNLVVKKGFIEYLDVKKTGKPYDYKICNICHILKANSEFAINQTDAKGRKTTRPSCKICRIEIDGVGLLPAERKKLDATKPKDIFTCPICQKTTIVGVTANLVKDHDHITGKGRGWICDSCNTGLGRFKDDIKLLEHIVRYLKSFEEN